MKYQTQKKWIMRHCHTWRRAGSGGASRSARPAFRCFLAASTAAFILLNPRVTEPSWPTVSKAAPARCRSAAT